MRDVFYWWEGLYIVIIIIIVVLLLFKYISLFLRAIWLFESKHWWLRLILIFRYYTNILQRTIYFFLFLLLLLELIVKHILLILLIWWGYRLSSSFCAIVLLLVYRSTTAYLLYAILFLMMLLLRCRRVRIRLTRISQSDTSKGEMVLVLAAALFDYCIWFFAAFVFLFRGLVNSHLVVEVAKGFLLLLWLLQLLWLILVKRSLIHSLNLRELKMIVTAICTSSFTSLCNTNTLALYYISAWNWGGVLFKAIFWVARDFTI